MSVRATDEVLDWMAVLADRCVPDEVDLAPDVLSAYLGGGTGRRQLFAAPRADPGAFGGGLALQLPYVLDALAVCCGTVKAFVGDPAVNTVVASASLAAAVRQMRLARHVPVAPTPTVPDAPAASATVVPDMPVASAEPEPAPDGVLPEAPDQARRALAALVERLQTNPVTADRAEETATAVLATIAADPPRALQALAVLEAAPPP